MPWDSVQLGPFYGGLNTLSDPSGLEDNELADCVNLELDLNGSLIVRPPIKTVPNTPTSTSRLRIIGSAVLNTTKYLIVANDTTVWAFNGTIFTQITTGVFASKALQYRSFVYIVVFSTSAATGGRWDGTTYTNIATMPKGTDAVIYKERMWIPSGTQSGRLQFSNIADPAIWSSTDFFDISPGDGQSLWHCAIFNNNLLIFKSDSTYILSYEDKPANATLDKISNTIGTSSYRCIAQNQNIVFVYHEGKIYQLVNYEFVQVNQRVVFQFDGDSPSAREDNVVLSFVGNRLIVRFFNRIYVYSVLTQAWTRWESADADINNFSGFYAFPLSSAEDVEIFYYSGSALESSNKMFVMKDTHTITDVETPLIQCKIRTKDYTADVPWKFKRLFFWGADVMTNREIVGTATPITFTFTPTWGDIQNMEWDSLNTWNMPDTESIKVITTVMGGAGTLKRFIKFNKSIRFRQIHFEVELETDGSTLEGPNRFYSITLFLRANQTVAKQVS